MDDGTKQMVPKDKWQGVVLSSFISREVGYGFTPLQSVFDEVNRRQKTVNIVMWKLSKKKRYCF